ncbi:MAG: alpha-L-fucosidase [Gammaproteobacteria bacterium]|nr:alpha-L-fucosidase [Gammaproteobacteria bacterium]
MSADIKPWSARSYRRLLVDTQIPDWDPGFLVNYDPVRVADEVVATGAQAVMVYFQSHVGVCNWPAVTGAQHKAFQGRDMVSETLAAMKARHIPVCAYYSVNFNNWAYLEHPDWRIDSLTKGSMGILPRARYGLCCMNNQDYRAFVHAQVLEFLDAYDMDAVFFDMMWWPAVCGCASCRERYQLERGAAIPDTIEWLDPVWCMFQKTREDWITDFIVELRDLVQEKKPRLQVYHNFALGMANWTRGISFRSARGHDFLGGDFYGGQTEQLVISRLMLNLSEQTPVEFMTTVGANLIEHVGLKDEQELALQNFAAVASSSAFLMIAAFDPDGRLNPAVPQRIRAVYDQTAPYEPFLGGQPVEDIAIYFSDDSKMNFADNGMPLSDAVASSGPDYPHFHAVAGACRALQAAHMPFGVITKKQLGVLSRYPVVVLANVLRMTAEEAAAFRDYVRNGGRLYASRWTSLTDSAGRRHNDFMLAEVFGCHYMGEETGRVVYLDPIDPDLRIAIAPQEMLSHWRDARQMSGALRLRRGTGKTLATLTLPYGYPSKGSVGGKDWASIHSSPPWEHVDAPTIVENTFGKGRAMYAAADLECRATGANRTLFVTLMRRLLDQPPRFSSDTHPAVWMTAFDQPDRRQTIASFLNYQAELPGLPIGSVPFELRPPQGETFGAVKQLPGEETLAVARSKDGAVSGMLTDLGVFAMIVAEWGSTGEWDT